jgi:hypothetical protein
VTTQFQAREAAVKLYLARHAGEIEPIAGGLRASMSRYEFPELVDTPGLYSDMDRSVVDQEGLVRAVPTPPLPSDATALMERIGTAIFAARPSVELDLWLPENDPTERVLALWEGAAAMLDSARYDVIHHPGFLQAAMADEPPPAERAAFFAWQLLVLEAMMVTLPEHLASLALAHFRRFLENSYRTRAPFLWLFDDVRQMFETPEHVLHDELMTHLLAILDRKKDAVVRWLDGSVAARTELGDILRQDPLTRVGANFSELRDLETAWARFGLPADALRDVIGTWASSHFVELMGFRDFKLQREQLESFAPLVGSEVCARMQRLAAALDRPLNQRTEIAPQDGEHRSSVGEYRIVQAQELNEDGYESVTTDYDVLQLRGPDGWDDLLRFEIHCVERDLMEGRRREFSRPPLANAVFVDAERGTRFVERLDGELWTSSDGRSWQSCESAEHRGVKLELYEHRIPSLRRIDLPRG